MLGPVGPAIEVFVVEMGVEVVFVRKENAKMEMCEFCERLKSLCECNLNIWRG
jgi:hypothetical protein